MPIPAHISERLKRLTFRQVVDYLRSRPWLSGTTAICIVLLGLILWFQTGESTYVADEDEFDEWPAVELGQTASAPSPLPQIQPKAAPTAPNAAAESSLPAWGTVHTIPTERPHADEGIQPVHAEPYRRSATPPAWLTGTIEPLSNEAPPLRFGRSAPGPSTPPR